MRKKIMERKTPEKELKNMQNKKAVTDEKINAAEAALGLKKAAGEHLTADMTPISFDERYKTKIIIVRHGESIGNATRVFLGHTDRDLSERGYLQAARTDEFLADVKIDAVYTSDLIRAYNTALPHAKRRNIEVIPSRELREMYAGDWENLKVDDIIERWEDGFIRGWREQFGVYTIPNGESPLSVADRLFGKISEIARENEGKTVLIGCHAAAIRLFWGKISGIPFENLANAFPYPNNASVSVVYFDGERLIPGEYSHDAHLSDI
jgi:broad specificity phosphatase PhoE